MRAKIQTNLLNTPNNTYTISSPYDGKSKKEAGNRFFFLRFYILFDYFKSQQRSFCHIIFAVVKTFEVPEYRCVRAVRAYEPATCHIAVGRTVVERRVGAGGAEIRIVYYVLNAPFNRLNYVGSDSVELTACALDVRCV